MIYFSRLLQTSLIKSMMTHLMKCSKKNNHYTIRKHYTNRKNMLELDLKYQTYLKKMQKTQKLN